MENSPHFLLVEAQYGFCHSIYMFRCSSLRLYYIVPLSNIYGSTLSCKKWPVIFPAAHRNLQCAGPLDSLLYIIGNAYRDLCIYTHLPLLPFTFFESVPSLTPRNSPWQFSSYILFFPRAISCSHTWCVYILLLLIGLCALLENQLPHSQQQVLKAISWSGHENYMKINK